jgi:hypothetical protein
MRIWGRFIDPAPIELPRPFVVEDLELTAIDRSIGAGLTNGQGEDYDSGQNGLGHALRQ